MLSFINIRQISETCVKWAISHFYVGCDLIETRYLPKNFKSLPGKSDFAFLFTKNNLYFIDKTNNTFTAIHINKQEITNLKKRLGVVLPTVQPPVYLIEEKLNTGKVREIVRTVDFAPPRSFIPLLNAIVLCGVFGFIPGAWTIGFPALVLYGLTKQRVLGRLLFNSILQARYFYHNFFRIMGETTGEILHNHTPRLLKCAGALFILLSMALNGLFLIPLSTGFNTWSAVALYGIYRFSSKQWLKACKRLISSSTNFGFYSTQHMTFYKKIAFFMGLAALTAWIFFSYGPILLPLCILNTIAVAAGFTILIKDLIYIYKNLTREFFDNSGKLFGAFWGRWIAYRIFSGHVTGNIGPAIGYVFTPGLISGFFSSFLSPAGSFTVGEGFLAALNARIQHALGNIIAGVFFTTEMQVQGTFYGTVGPTSLQIFAFMLMGYFVGYFIERLVKHITQNVINDSVSLPKNVENVSKNLRQQTKELAPQYKGHIIFFSVATALLMCSPAGPSLIAFAHGSSLAGTMLGLGGLVLTWNAFEYAALGVRYWINRPQDQARGQRNGPAQQASNTTIPVQERRAAFIPGFRASQRNTREQTNQSTQTQPIVNEQIRPT